MEGLPMHETLDQLIDKVREMTRMRVTPCPCGPWGQPPVSMAVIHSDGTLTCAECGKAIAIAE